MADREFGFKTRAIHAGNIPDAVTGARALPDLPVDRVRLRRHRGCRRPLRPAEVRQHLLAASRTRPWRASRSASRASRADSAPSPPPRGLSAQFITFARLAGAGDHIVASREPLRRLDHAARRHAAPLRRRDHVRALVRPRRLRRGDHREDQGCSSSRRSRTRRARSPTSRASRRSRTPHGIPLIVDSTDPDAVPQPPDRVGRRHRHRTRRRSSSAATARRSAASSSSRVASTGRSDKFPLFDQPVPTTAASTGTATSASTRSSRGCAPSSCATSAPRSRRTPRSCSRRASRRSRTASRRTSTTRAPSPSGSRPTRASST